MLILYNETKNVTRVSSYCCTLQKRSISKRDLLIAGFGTASLGVQVFIANHHVRTFRKSVYISFRPEVSNIPFNSPVHQRVGHNEWRSNVEDLMAESAEGVEDGGVPEVGEQALAVGREGIGGNSLFRAGN